MKDSLARRRSGPGASMKGKTIVGSRMGAPSTSARVSSERRRARWLQLLAVTLKPPTLPIVTHTLTEFSSSPDVMDESQPPLAL